VWVGGVVGGGRSEAVGLEAGKANFPHPGLCASYFYYLTAGSLLLFTVNKGTERAILLSV
jgi:hypothetical protein